MASIIRDSRPIETIQPASTLADRIAEFVQDGLDLDGSPHEVAVNENTKEGEFWRVINPTPTSLWLDSGDLEAIQGLWGEHFQGLTTNNSLVNKEIQRGSYDDLIRKAAELVGTLEGEARTREIAFILNVRHAMRLVEQFRCPVSVELHTDVANDVDATLAFARRCHALCPEYFVVKIPLTASGLIAIRRLREEGIAVNCTLGFSARQNYFATAWSRPSFVNVFVGRLNSYVAENELGDGELIGEKAVMASQQEINTFSRALPATDTKQIAASVRSASQLPLLAGVDVITMPSAVARSAIDEIHEPWANQVLADHQIKMSDRLDPENIRIDKLWDVSKHERSLAQALILDPPKTADEICQAAKDHGVDDLFPAMTSSECEDIERDGKIPNHERWKHRILRGDLAVDSLMSMAGLSAFANSQAELDQRICQQI